MNLVIDIGNTSVKLHLFENDELIEMRIYYKSSRAWGESTAIDTAEKWCLGLIH